MSKMKMKIKITAVTITTRKKIVLAKTTMNDCQTMSHRSIIQTQNNQIPAHCTIPIISIRMHTIDWGNGKGSRSVLDNIASLFTA
jgi:hypothetical protein